MTITQTSFHGLGLGQTVLGALESAGFQVPTPIQEKAIPVATTGADVVGIAQTGTGKTLAFALPMIERLLKNPEELALVLAPTRELALQIDETFRKVGNRLGIRTSVLIGGEPIRKQISQLRTRPRVLVATPGRLKDHLEQGTVRLDGTRIVVLDEADRMLDMGFAPDIERILKRVPTERQTMLFSATMPPEIEALARRYTKNAQRLEVARAGTTAELVTQELIYVPQEMKVDLLGKLLGENPGTILVFSRTRHGARKVAKAVNHMGHSAAELHSDRTLAQRRTALDGFKQGKHRVLVATDIAARGIDVKEISLVINFDLPDQAEDYVHRIGRTGRAGAEGRALTLATPEQVKDVRAIERLVGNEIPRVEREDLPKVDIAAAKPFKRPAPGPRQGGRPGGNRPPFAGGKPSGSRPSGGHGPSNRGGSRPAAKPSAPRG